MPPKKAPAKPKAQKMVGKPDEGASDEDDVAQSKANAKLAPKSSNANVVRNCSIVTVPGGEIPTIVGPISQWAPVVENLPNNPTCVFFGKRRTGKSTTITNLAYHTMRDIPFGIVMSNTTYAGYWDQILPKRHIVQGLRQDVLDWLVSRQKKAIAKYGIKGK